MRILNHLPRLSKISLGNRGKLRICQKYTKNGSLYCKQWLPSILYPANVNNAMASKNNGKI